MKYGFVNSYANVYDEEWIKFCLYLKFLYKSISHCPNSNKVTSIHSLPEENLLNIFGYFDAESLCAAASVTTLWTPLTLKESFWEYLCIDKFNISACAFRSFGKHPAKQLYVQTKLYFKDLIKKSPGFRSRPIIPSSFLTAMA